LHYAGYMFVRKGKRETWAEESKGLNHLYHVRGTNQFDTTAQQTEAKAFSLNSNDVFVLVTTGDVVYVWHGKGANEFETKTGVTMVDRILDTHSKKTLIIAEESEPQEFWDALGGKGEYSNAPELATGDIRARLFQCTDRTGVFKVEEISDFTQDDLDNDDVMLLDAYHVVYVWIGKGSTENERKKGQTLAVEYIKAADDGRTDGCPIYVVDSGSEPIQFTLHFHGWNDIKAMDSEDVYSRKLRELQLTSAVVGGHEAKDYNAGGLTRAASEMAPKAASQSIASINPNSLTISFDRLKVKPLPEGVDGGNIESFLSPGEFQSHFKMTHEEFYKLPKWKQLRVKKEVGLF